MKRSKKNVLKPIRFVIKCLNILIRAYNCIIKVKTRSDSIVVVFLVFFYVGF